PAVQGAWLEGTMGGVTADRAAGASGTATIDTGLEGLRIDMENTSARWWVMTRIEFSRTLDLRTVPVGTVITPDSGYYSAASAVPSIVHVQGCSGPSHGDWNYDEASGDVSVRVEAGSRPDTRTLVLTAGFGANTMHGAVELQVP